MVCVWGVATLAGGDHPGRDGECDLQRFDHRLPVRVGAGAAGGADGGDGDRSAGGESSSETSTCFKGRRGLRPSCWIRRGRSRRDGRPWSRFRRRMGWRRESCLGWRHRQSNSAPIPWRRPSWPRPERMERRFGSRSRSAISPGWGFRWSWTRKISGRESGAAERTRVD